MTSLPLPSPAPRASPAPSAWVQRWSHLVAPGAEVLDVACGSGRHLRWFAGRGHPVLGVDRDAAALAAAGRWGPVLQADLENAPWPLAGREFGAVVVTNYLWRPRKDAVLAAVAPAGLLIYETFAAGNETVGKPGRPDFLLQPGELLRWCQGPDWRVAAYEDGFAAEPDRFVQRIAAVRLPWPPTGEPPRWRL